VYTTNGAETMNLRKSIRIAMARLECNQGEFADLSQITRAYLSSIMGGTSNPSIVVIERMAAASGLSVSNFIAQGEV